MPVALIPNPVGLGLLVCVKFLGYSGAGYFLQARHPEANVTGVVFGAARTVLGIVVGAAFGAVWWHWGSDNPLHLYAALLPVRLLEWCGAISWFFDRSLSRLPKTLSYSLGGSAWSYALDAMAGVVISFTGALDTIVC